MSEDELLFPDNHDDTGAQDNVSESNECWKILIVDDEPEIHQITRLTLVDCEFEGRKLEYYSAYSATEALKILADNPDIALMLLDVVMETDHAGLELVHKVRHTLGNTAIRIILRTGQPGEAPERDIISNYDINDYTEKTELSAQKLYTIVIAGLRSYRDILKLMNSQMALQESNQKLADERERIQVTLDSIGDGVVTTDAEGHITHLNPVAEQLTGWTADEARGHEVREVFPIIDSSSGESIENPVEKVIKSGETVYLSNHTTLISKTGDRYHIADSAAPIRDKEGHILGMVLVFNDVTEQYRLRQVAEQNRRNLQMIMDHIPSVIYAKDTQGRYIFVNRRFEEITQMDKTDVTGMTDDEIFTGTLREMLNNHDQTILQTGKTIEYETETEINGEIRHYLSIKFPLRENDNNYAICGISTDITDRMKQEEQLRRSQKMKALGQLTGGIAHDFNNQMGIVIGYLDMLAENTGSKDSKKWIDAATRATLRCTDLTRQLLSFSRTKTDEASVVNINSIIREIEPMLSRTTPSIDIEYVLGDNIWPCELNPGEFQDAVLNMVINARDAMPHGGNIIIETSNIILDSDNLRFNEDIEPGSFVQLMISDTGKGMEKHTLERVFEPFYTTKDKDKGTGLGMSMVYGFVKRSHGFIKIYSEKDLGTTVRIYLPSTHKQQDSTDIISTSGQDLPTGRETLLVVDDEQDLLLLTKECLLGLGYKVYIAENASQALGILEKNKDIDLLFSDIVMPGGINGYELAEKACQLQPGIKVLLTSGYTSKTLARNGQKRFAAQILTKPYRKIDMATRIRNILDDT